MIIIQSGHMCNNQHNMFTEPILICQSCSCMFLADDDKDFSVEHDEKRVRVSCPECGYGVLFPVLI